MVLLWVESRIVNALLFLVIDVCMLWVVAKCLHALQGFYLYRLARKGQTIRIARSRIPIVSGELLRSNSLLSFSFIIINVTVLVMAFLGTLGVNGETRKKYTPVKLSNVTTVSGGLRLDTRNDVMEYTLRPASFACSQRNVTSIGFWPVAFNLRDNMVPIDMACQSGAPGVAPLMYAECVVIANDSCVMNQIRPEVLINATVDFMYNSSTRNVFIFSDTAIELRRTVYEFSSTISNFNLFTGITGKAFVFERVSKKRTQGKRGVFVLRDMAKNVSYLSYGVVMGRTTRTFIQSRMNPPVRLTPESLTHNDSHVADVLRNHYPVLISGHTGPVISQFLEDLIYYSYGTEELKGLAYKTSEQDATVISTEAIALFSILVAVSLMLCVLKGVIHFYLVHKRRVERCELRCNDFDQLSMTLRREMERSHRAVRYSSDYAFLGNFIDGNQAHRVRPVVPNSILSRNNSDAEHVPGTNAHAIRVANTEFETT